MAFWRNYYHLVWQTHERADLLVPSIESEVYTYIIDLAAGFDVYIYAIGGLEDHLHLAAAIPPVLSVSQLVKEIKQASVEAINNQLPPHQPPLAWQRGYGCMTIGEGQLSVAINYVKSQRLLHADQQTNAWLERADTQDEGPTDPGLSVRIAALFRERPSDYNLDLGQPPF